MSFSNRHEKEIKKENDTQMNEKDLDLDLEIQSQSSQDIQVDTVNETNQLSIQRTPSVLSFDQTFSTKWNCYYHSSYNNDWSWKSYELFQSFSSLQEYIQLYNSIEQSFPILNLYFFKEGRTMCWEDTCNRDGIYISFMIEQKEQIPQLLNQIALKILTGTLYNIEHDYNNINGFSLNQKYKSCLVKIHYSDTNIPEWKNFTIEEQFLNKARITSNKQQLNKALPNQRPQNQKGNINILNQKNYHYK